jgi:ATP-binding cassette subfamily B protein
VDTITNIKTVKLFAHAAFEDRVAIEAMEVFREKSLEFGVISTWFRLSLMTLAGVLPVILIGGAVLLWAAGETTAGAIAASGAIAMRNAQMSGWVSFTLMSIYTSVGEVEDAMKTLARPHTLADAPNAQELPPVKGEVRFDHASFAYGRQRGGVARHRPDDPPGREDWHCRRLGGGQILTRGADAAAFTTPKAAGC